MAKKIYLILGMVLVVSLALYVGWLNGRATTSSSSNSSNASGTPQASNPPQPNGANDVKKLVSYSLPDGWKETSCPDKVGTVYVLPSGIASADCSANPSAPVKLSIDPQHSQDCNDLKPTQAVTKHVCISTYINGVKSLKASTTYMPSAIYKQPTTISSYYVAAGGKVVEADYTYTTDNPYKTGFDSLANSVKAL